MKLTNITKKQAQILFEFMQDPSGCGDHMDEWLSEEKLWASYSRLMRKIETLVTENTEKGKQ